MILGISVLPLGLAGSRWEIVARHGQFVRDYRPQLRQMMAEAEPLYAEQARFEKFNDSLKSSPISANLSYGDRQQIWRENGIAGGWNMETWNGRMAAIGDKWGGWATPKSRRIAMLDVSIGGGAIACLWIAAQRTWRKMQRSIRGGLSVRTEGPLPFCRVNARNGPAVRATASESRQFSRKPNFGGRYPHQSTSSGAFASLSQCRDFDTLSTMNLPKFSMGIGDRFAHQGKAQLAAFVKAKTFGVEVAPVWNKSNREHLIVHSEPTSVREEADAAVAALGWKSPYFVDADHIGVKTVDRFIGPSDFFTLDVADFINKPAADADVTAFASNYGRYAGSLKIPGITTSLDISSGRIEAIARKYLYAAQEAGRIYRHVEAAKGKGNFVTEISMDETDQPQTPGELFFILAAIADQKIPVQTIAPKFTGRFNKGVDYVGDVQQFEKEFNDDLAVIAHAIKEFGLPANLKLSVHSGSDKFSIYAAIRKAVQTRGAGLHVKTAGTTWLEELIGLASAGGEGLQIAKDVYRDAMGRFDELCGPYATVIDIDKARLPSVDAVSKWSGTEYAETHATTRENPRYNANFRQLLHVGFKVAAQMGDRYISALEKFETSVAENVTKNIYDRHLKPIFVG